MTGIATWVFVVVPQAQAATSSMMFTGAQLKKHPFFGHVFVAEADVSCS